LDGASGYSRALERHQRAGAPMLVYVGTAWCHFCRQFEAEVLSSGRVQEFLGPFAKAKVDPDTGPEESHVAATLGARGYPTILVWAAGASHPTPIHDYADPGKFIQACARAA